MDREKIVGWIQKLMNKAMDPASSPGETESLQEKVAQLMAKYKISEMEATTPEEIEDHEMMREEIKFAQKGRMTWGFYLAWGIAPIFECEAVKAGGTQKMMFFGFPDDVATVAFFFRWFQLQIIGFADESSYRTVKDKNSYAHGMVRKITARVSAAYKRAKEIVPSECRDLILVKEGAVENFRKREIGGVVSPRKRLNVNHKAYQKGYVDGDRVDIVNPHTDKLRN
jgi:hypothetical protein